MSDIYHIYYNLSNLTSKPSRLASTINALLEQTCIPMYTGISRLSMNAAICVCAESYVNLINKSFSFEN